MSMRVGASQISPPGVQSTPLGLGQRAAQTVAPAVGQQISQALFGRPPPRLLDPAQFPELMAMLRQLSRFQKKFSALAGDADDAYQLVLAESATAAVDAEGRIYLGAQFLRDNRHQPEVILGALAHEIGHQPGRWRRRRRRRAPTDAVAGSEALATDAADDEAGQGQADPEEARQLSPEQLDEICQVEETRADLFAGEALAELGYSCEPLVTYLADHESGPHRRYLPAVDRGAIIRGAHAARQSVLKQRRQLFPDYERHRAARGHVGSL